MCSLRTVALALMVSAIRSVLATDEIPPPPPASPVTTPPVPVAKDEPKRVENINPDGAKVLCVALPRDGRLDKAEVDIQLADGQTVSAAAGKPLDGRWLLEKLAWSEDGEEMVVTLRNGEEQRELRAGGELIVQNGARRRAPSQVEVQSLFYEVPALANRQVRRALDATPGEDRTVFEMLDRALDGGAPAQLLTPPQFEALTKFLAGCREVDTVSTPRVTTKSGQRAVIEIIREFRYPIEWKNDPTLPKPLTPVAFETRACGVTLEVEPTVKANGSLVSLQAMPQVVEFLGAADLEKGTPFPNKNRARHLSERANQPISMPSTKGRPVRYVFSARKTKAHADLLPGYGLLLTDLYEAEAEAPFQKAAPRGRLIVLVKADVIAQ